MKYPASLSLLDGGKVTGHKVKYSHHPDGRVHFSQDGKIRTVIQKKSIPLSEAEGHLFTVQLQGLKDFGELSAKEKQPLLSEEDDTQFSIRRITTRGNQVCRPFVQEALPCQSSLAVRHQALDCR